MKHQNLITVGKATRKNTRLRRFILVVLVTVTVASSAIAATFSSPVATWTGGSDFDTSESPIFLTLSGVTGLTIAGTSDGNGHAHAGAGTTLTIELYDPNTAAWNVVHSISLLNNAEFHYDGLSITFASQDTNQIRLFSNPFQDNSFHSWDDEVFTLIYGALPVPLAGPVVVPEVVTFEVTDVGAIFSTLQSGLPLALAQRQILLNTLRTAMRDVGGRLFLLRAGLSLGDENTTGAAGPTGRELVHRGSDGKTVSNGKDYKATPEESFRHWELFAAGDYGKYDVDDIGSLRGYNSDVWVGTVGGEYRINKHLAFGLAASYVNSDTDISRNIGGMSIEGMAFSAYGSAVWRDFYFDLLYSYGALDEDIQRRTLVGQTAHGDVENRSNALQFNTGYNLRLGGLRTGPLASAEWIHGELEGYRETGGGTAALDFPGQSYDSLISRLGWQASYTAKTSFGAITPQVRASWDHEYLDSADSVSASLLATPFTTITGSKVTRGDKFTATADTAQPGRDYLNLGAGLSAQFGDRISATLQYETHLFQAAASAHLASVRISVAF